MPESVVEITKMEQEGWNLDDGQQALGSTCQESVQWGGENFLCVKTVCPCGAVRPGRLGSISPGTVGGPEPPEWAHPTQEIRVPALGWSQGCVFGETSTDDALARQGSRWGNGVQCTSRIQKSLGKKQKCRGNGWTKMFKYFLFINNIILFIYTKDWKALTWSTLR